MTPDVVKIALNGKVRHFISRKELSEVLNVDVSTISKYQDIKRYDKPLERVNNGELGIKGRKMYFDYLGAVSWYIKNVDRDKDTSKPKGRQYDDYNNDGDSDVEYKIGDKITPQNMSVAKKLEEAVNEKLKREKLQIELDITKGTFKPIDALDRALAEISRLMLSELRNMLDNLPKEVFECKTLEETEVAVDRSAEDLVKTISTAIESISLDNEGTMDE